MKPRFKPPRFPILALLALAAPDTALASPGIGEEVYGTQIETHEIELEARYGQLSGGPEGGNDNARFEASYGVTKNLALATVIEFEREGPGSRKATHLGFEAVYRLGRVAGIDVAAYQEFELGLNGNADASETKLLLQKRTGLWDIRFNLIGEKHLAAHEPLEFGYAASADVAVAKRLRLGLAAFGDLGTVDHFGPAAEHYVGPIAKFRFPRADPDGDGDDEGGFVIEAGYLFAVGATTRQTSGQFRLNLELEL